MNKVLAGLACLVLISSCGDRGHQNFQLTSSHIIDGKIIDAQDSLARYTVGVTNKNVLMVCTGTIIAENIILTAAHCVEHDEAKDMRVVFGSKIRDPKNTVSAEAVSIHKDYIHDTNIDNDIALIKIVGKIPSSYKVLDVERSSQLLLEKGTLIKVAGFGKNKNGFFGGGGAGILRKGQVTLDEYSAEEKLLVLDQTNENGICNGDSGGGAFVELDGELIQLGVNSFVPSKKSGFSKGDCKKKSYLTNIAYYLDWIQLRIAELN